MTQPLAVTFIHGVEISDPDFARTAIEKLRRAFTRYAQVDADEALVIEPSFWAPELQAIEDQLFDRSFDEAPGGFFTRLTEWVSAIDAGSSGRLLMLMASGALRWLPGAGRLHYPTMRWVVTQFLGDAVAYQLTPTDRQLYDRIHGRVADALRLLAERAGPAAPLCVISHSLGTVIASNYFYDLQNARSLVPRSVHAVMGDTAIERGETLAYLYTMGCPIPLWNQRFPDFGKPLTVPAPGLRHHHRGLSGEWVNFFDRDDLIAYPLRPLSPAYARQVSADRPVSVGPWWAGGTPLSHLSYWNDDAVINPIAQRLAQAWHDLNDPARTRPAPKKRARPARVATG
jgi:hypothetical protein